MALRLVFMGTPDFSVPTLLEIIGRGHEVAAVYTRAPKPGGRRGLELQETPVALAAHAHNIPVHTPVTLKTAEAQEAFRAHEADAAVVVAYGLLLPKAVLDAVGYRYLEVDPSDVRFGGEGLWVAISRDPRTGLMRAASHNRNNSAAVAW